MTAMLVEERVSDTGSDDNDDIVHYYCCEATKDRGFCGEDLTQDVEEITDELVICAVCADLLELPYIKGHFRECPELKK